MKDVGAFIFIPALLLTFVYRRIAAAIAIAASLLCLPLYLYFVAPGPFRWVFRGEYSIPLHANFVWNSQAVVAIVALVMAVFFGVRNLTIQRPTPRVPQSSAVETHLGANHIK
jgi:Na+(H+)/acetate symporter ActP